jgi:multicomponent Na+:H+ antiporter subunit D
MMPAPQTLLLLVLLLPAATAAAIPFLARVPNLREAVTLAGAAALLAASWGLAAAVLAGAAPALALGEILPGLGIGFAVEPLGALFAAVAGTLWLVNSLYAIGYMRANGEPRQTTFYFCFAVAIAAAMGVAMAGNLFTLFLFYEMLTLSTYPLVTHDRSAEAIAAGRVYLLTLLGTSMLLFLPAIVWTGVAAGTLGFAPGGILAGRIGDGLMAVLLALYVFGIGKAAVMPVHRWLPAAMVAPTPVSALLHAVAVVKAGVFALLKVIVYVFGIDALSEAGAAGWLVWVAGFTVIAASVIALREDNLKRRLAYSTVSQLSYVVLAAAVLAPLSIAGAALHIAAHAVSKITLFFAAGSFHTAAHADRVGELQGIGRRMPWTMAAFAVAALSVIGVPPTIGFASKWFMLSGAVQSGAWVAVAVIAASTVLNAGYFLPIVRDAFLKPAPEGEGPVGEGPAPMLIALIITGAGTVLLFLLPGPLAALARALVPGAQP